MISDQHKTKLSIFINNFASQYLHVQPISWVAFVNITQGTTLVISEYIFPATLSEHPTKMREE